MPNQMYDNIFSSIFALIMILGSKYGDDNIRFIVNDMLLNIDPLRPVFLPDNKCCSQARESAMVMNKAHASDKQIMMFPAGLVSRLHPDGEIRDLQWQKSLVVKAIKSGRKIVFRIRSASDTLS